MSPNPPPPNPQPQPQYPPQPYPPQPYPPQPYPPGAYPAPAYYAQPVYAAPVMVAMPGQNTFGGLKWLRYATMLALVVNALEILVGILGTMALSSLATGGLGAFSGPVIALLAVGLVAGLLALIAFILGMVGYYNVHQGRSEFGEPHVQSVKRSTMWFAIACVSYLGVIIAGVFIGFGSAFGVAASLQSMANTMIISGAVTGAIGVVYIFAAGMTMQLILERLMTAEGRARRSMFLMLSVIGGIAALVVNVVVGLMAAGSLTSLSTVGSLSSLTGISSLVAAVSLITLFLYLKQLQSAEQGARTMISTGRYDPDGGVVPAVVAAPAPPPM